MLILTNIDLNGNQIQNFVVHPVATLPQTAKEGQLVYNSTDKYIYKFDGTEWINVELPYILPIASSEILGGVKVGNALSIDSEGILDVVESEIEAGSIEWENVKSKPFIPKTAEDVGAIPSTDKGFANGVAELDENGLVPSNQLPSYVDDVLEFANKSSFPQTGESGKIYVAQDTNLTYRWTGTTYVEISKSLALGETSSTAFRGDRGKTAYDHSQLRTGNPHNVTLSDLGISLSDDEINALPDSINNLKLVKITEGTLATTATTKTLSVTGGKIFSVMVYDSVTFEEVITDKKYNSARSSVTIKVAKAPENTLNIVVSYIMS